MTAAISAASNSLGKPLADQLKTTELDGQRKKEIELCLATTERDWPNTPNMSDCFVSFDNVLLVVKH